MARQFRRNKQPLIDTLLAAGLEARPRDPYFERRSDGWRWHASQLANCPRQQILARAGITPDGTPLQGKLTMELGTYFHGVAEDGARALAGFSVSPDCIHPGPISIVGDDDRLPLLGCELGGDHPELPLAARADIVLGERDDAFILEIKAEGHYSFTGRRKDAREKGSVTAARPEHRLQAAAQAETLEARGDVESVTDVVITYIDRDTAERDEQPAIIDERWRAAVPRRVGELEGSWAIYEATEVLPPPLPDMDKNWRCRPIDEKNPCGKYCPSRTACLAFIAEGR